VKKKDLALAVAAVLVIAALAYGLSRRSQGLPLTPSSPFKAETAAAKKSNPNDKVIMRVNGVPVTESEFTALAQGAPAESRAFYASPAGRKAMAEELARMKALQQEGERMKLADDPEVVAQLDAARGQIIAGRALQILVEKRAEPMIQKAYTEQKGSSILLSHIAIAYAGGQIPARDPNAKLSEAQAMAKARDIVKQLRGGTDFGATAAAVSDDLQSGQKGGLLGPVQREQLAQMLPPEAASAVGQLKPGQISDPVKTQFAIHIFRVAEPSLDDLRPMLSQQVKQQAAQEEMERIGKSAKIEYDPKFFPPAPAASPNSPQPKPE
jgi:parvulin-like peptidyl-prolyl isomerase